MESFEAPSGARIHVNPDDQAGQRALARGGPKDREQRLWSFLANELSYQAVYDLGANYGQVTLGAAYPPETEVVLVEPNPQLVPYLQRSIETHPNREQIKLHSLALGNHDGSANLFIRTEAQGKSSLVQERGESTPVPLTTLDALASPSAGTRDAIIKLDVEGSELALLEGAAETLSGFDNYAIMIELHPGYMRMTADSVGRYVELLCSYGRLWEQNKSGAVKPFDFARFVRRGKLHDILIVSGDRYTAQIREAKRRIDRPPRQAAEAPAVEHGGTLHRLRQRLAR